MAVTRTASDVDDRVQEKLLEYYQKILARDSPTEQWYLLTQIGSALRQIDLEPHLFDFTIFRNSRVRDMYWELWKVLAPIYHNNGCQSLPYQPLGQYEIRLISLIKHDGQKLVCRLDTYPHWLAPEYDALSYVWGDPTEATVIICNGTELSIGTPLHVALRLFLEGAARPLRPLWIDAICLNQQDDDEKAHQVPCMGNIYKLATRTLIWLGEAADESDKAMDFLRELDQKTKNGEATQEEEAMVTSLQTGQIGRRMVKSIVALLRRSWFSRLWTRERQTNQNGRRVNESIVALLQRSWFSRLWTMQEAALSRNCQVVCGGKSLEWSAIQTFRATLPKLEFRPLNSMPGLGRFGLLEIISTLFILEGCRLGVFKGQVNNVRELFLLSESKNCKEAVDRIWAVLALFPNSLQQRVREAGMIDYSASGKRQYWKTYLSFVKLLYLESPMSAWNVIYHGQGLVQNANLPSWCPDFSATRQYNKYFYLGEDCRAGFSDDKSSINPTFLLSPESAFLTVKGFTFDTVQSITQNVFPALLNPTPSDEVSEDERIAFPNWLQETSRLVQETFGMSWEAVVRLCQMLLEVKQAPVSTEAWQQDHKLLVQSVAFAYLYEAWPSGPRNIDLYREQLNNITLEITAAGTSRYFLGRTFITTTQKRIGFGTADMRNGDLICIVEGAGAVFVLRSVDHDTVLSSGVHSPEDLDQYPELFRLVGDAYVHGCMHGEAFTASDRGPDREFTLA